MLTRQKLRSRQIGVLAVIFLVLSQVWPAFMPLASAGTLTNTLVRFDNMDTSAFTSGLVCAKQATSGTDTSVMVTFPTGFTVSTTTSNWTTSTASTTGWPSGATAWPGIGTATSVSGQSVTFPSTTLTTGTLYCFNWTNSTAALQQPSAAANSETGTITTQASGPTTIDSGTFATSTISNDQISVSGSVNPSFSISFAGGSTDALGTLTTAAVASSSTVTFTVSTNAKNGWMAWVKDANSGLTSSSAGYTISSTSTPGLGNNSVALTAGNEGYNLGITYAQTSGTCTSGSAVPSTFAGTSSKGGSFDTNLRNILTCSGTTNTGVVTPTNYAAINGATPAASDYSDTETFVAAGTF